MSSLFGFTNEDMASLESPLGAPHFLRVMVAAQKMSSVMEDSSMAFSHHWSSFLGRGWGGGGGGGTGCITWFSELENDVENANKTTNPIGIFTAWNIVMVI